MKHLVSFFKHRTSLQSIVSICVFAIVVRIVFIYVFTHFGHGDLLDSTRYIRVAYNILRGRGFAEYIRPTAFAPPIYAYFIAGIFKIFGQSVMYIKIIQAVIGGITCFIIFNLGKLLYNEKVGLLAAFITSLYPELVVLTNYLYTETLYIFLLCLTFLLLIKGFKKQTGWLIWALAGIVLGLSILTRHVLLLFPIFLLFTCIIFKNLHVYRKKVTVFLIACYIVITPWIIRNYMHFGKFVPVASGYGGSVWIGSHLPDQGEYKYADSREKAYNASSQTTDLNEKDRILFDKAVKNVLKNPLGFGWIFLKKLGRFFFQIYNFVPDGDNRQGRSGVSVFLGLCYYPLLGLSIIGILYSRSKWKNLFPIYSMIVYTSLAYSFTIVVPRYRIPILPFFFLLASYGFFSLIKIGKNIDH